VAAIEGLKPRRLTAGVTIGGAALFGASLYLDLELALMALVAVLLLAGLVILNPRWGLYLAILLMPLEGAGRVFGDLTTITWAKLALVATLLGLLLTRMVRREEILVPKGAWLLYLVFTCAVIGTAVSGARSGVVWGLLAFIGQAMIVIVMYNLVRDEETCTTTMVMIALSSVPVALFALMDFASGQSVLGTAEHRVYASASSGILRVTSTFNDPNALGTYMAFAAIITLGLLAVDRLRPWRPALVLALLLQGSSLILSFSRGAIAALIGALILYFFWQRGIRGRIAQLGGAGVVLVVASMGGLLGIVIERFRAGQGIAIDLSRLAIYREGLDLMWRSPVFGYGPDDVPYVLGEAFGAPVWPHNLYIEVALGVGLLGLLAMSAYVISHVRYSAALRKTEWSGYARTAVTGLVCILLSGITLHVFRANELWIALGLMAALPSVAGARRTTS